MSSFEFARAVCGFITGLGLGFLDFHLYEKSVLKVLETGEITTVRKLMLKASIFRHVFIFFAGIVIVWAARFPPIHLCGGLLASVFIYRWRLWKRIGRLEGESNE